MIRLEISKCIPDPRDFSKVKTRRFNANVKRYLTVIIKKQSVYFSFGNVIGTNSKKRITFFKQNWNFCLRAVELKRMWLSFFRFVLQRKCSYNEESLKQTRNVGHLTICELVIFKTIIKSLFLITAIVFCLRILRGEFSNYFRWDISEKDWDTIYFWNYSNYRG